MRQSLTVLAALLLAADAASSAVVYVDLPEPEGFLGIGPGNPFTKTFDFDGNGTTDLEFLAGVDVFGFYVLAPPTSRVAFVSLFGVLPMYPGEEIGSILGPTSNPMAALFPDDPVWTHLTGPARLSFLFNDAGNVTGGPWHPENDAAYGEDAYLGFEFQGDDGTHYGWLRIQEFAGVGGFFREYAYNDFPGESILAGQIPEPSTTVLLIGGFAFVVGRRRRNSQSIIG